MLWLVIIAGVGLLVLPFFMKVSKTEDTLNNRLIGGENITPCVSHIQEAQLLPNHFDLRLEYPHCFNDKKIEPSS